MISNSISEERRAILNMSDNFKKYDALLTLRKKIVGKENTTYEDLKSFIPKDIIKEYITEKEYIFK